jgi:hypothetical protein
MTSVNLLNLPNTRREAKKLNKSKYYTGKLCPNGHNTFRYTSYGQCADCVAVKNRNNRHKIYEQTKKNQEFVKYYIQNSRCDPCHDCKKNYPWYIMEFDHRNGRDENYRSIKNIRSIKRFEIELTKCDLVCRNCHGIRTYQRAVADGKRQPGFKENNHDE